MTATVTLSEYPGLSGARCVFKTVTGSQAYGTATPQSDVDHKGVYCQSAVDLQGFGYTEQLMLSKDESHFEMRRFVQLLCSANPTVLEMLFMPDDCVLHRAEPFLVFERERERFLTKKCLNSFGGYAVAQIRKARGLDKKMNWEKARVARKGPMDFCYAHVDGRTVPLADFIVAPQSSYGLVALDHFKDGYALYQDVPRSGGYRGIVSEDGNDVRVSSVPKGERPVTVVYFNREGYSAHCRDFREYADWEKNRNVQRYVDVEAHGQKIDGKNLLHCRRLIDTALEIAREGVLRVRRPNAEYLLSIRRGEVPLARILDEAERDLSLLDSAYSASALPDGVDPEFANELLLEARRAAKTLR